MDPHQQQQQQQRSQGAQQTQLQAAGPLLLHTQHCQTVIRRHQMQQKMLRVSTVQQTVTMAPSSSRVNSRMQQAPAVAEAQPRQRLQQSRWCWREGSGWMAQLPASCTHTKSRESSGSGPCTGMPGCSGLVCLLTTAILSTPV
jgi:hypothetical protein